MFDARWKTGRPGEIHEDPAPLAGRRDPSQYERHLQDLAALCAPLTLTTLAALVPEDLHAEVTIQDEGVQPLDLDFDADLVGITAITGTALRAYADRRPVAGQGDTRSSWAASIRRCCRKKPPPTPTHSCSDTPRKPGRNCWATSCAAN